MRLLYCRAARTSSRSEEPQPDLEARTRPRKRARLRRWPTRALGLSAVALATVPAFGVHLADFDGDGKDDVLLWNQNAWHVYQMDGRNPLSGPTIAMDLPQDTQWRVVGVGDLNGDGNDDVLFRHTSGRWFYYAMDGRETISEQSGRTGLPRRPGWEVAGIGDLDGDGSDEVLVRHESGRWLYYGADAEGSIAARSRITLPSGLAWRFAAIGDFNGDGVDDVLLRHVDGQWYYHGLDDDPPSRDARLPHDTGLRVAGTGDLNGDDNDDLLLRNSNGHWFYYPMDGRRVIVADRGRAAISASSAWQLAGIGDLDGDGRDDVLIRHAEGRWYYYAMDGRHRAPHGTGGGRLPRMAATTVCGEEAEAPSYVGQVAGYAGGSSGVEAILSGPGVLETVRPDSAGCFAFHDVPDGSYAVKINADGHASTPAREVNVAASKTYDSQSYDVEQLPLGPFTYHWEEDQTTAGNEYSSHVPQRREVAFQDKTVSVADPAAAEHLRQNYNVLLVGGWSQEHAFRLLETMQDIPQPIQDLRNDILLPASAWRLTDDFIDDDIVVTTAEDGSRDVTISSAAFVNAAPRLATVDGKRGVWYSKRLHRAAVRLVTDEGRDEAAYERILQDRYGLTTRIEDYAALTSPTGNESESNFQSFHSNEIVALINILEEMPSGMHKLNGMRFLVRRLNGLVHPHHPTAPAVAWPEAEYVEFMESAFREQTEDYMHRLIVHEKAHFLWAHLFDDQLKLDWIRLGGWFKDPSTESGWATGKPDEFVSTYMGLQTPDEDMAETIAFFITNPDQLRKRSTPKYEFVRDRVMQGDIYVAQIREDLTFEVYNIFPDYTYPGKIKQVDISVAGGPGEEKQFTLDVEVHALDGLSEGVMAAQTRVSSEVGTFFDLWLNPVDEGGNDMPPGEPGVRLRGQHTISEHAKSGYWVPDSITQFDEAGYEREQNVSDFGWRMFVDNPQEDVTAPEYLSGTLSASVSVWESDDTVQVIHVGWLVSEQTGMKSDSGCYAAINDIRLGTYSLEEYGNPSTTGDACNVDFLMPSYMPTSTYSMTRIEMEDVAGNTSRVEFTGDDATETPVTVSIETTNPDTDPPEVDVNRIEISAVPTNPDAPNGETEVTVRFRWRDNISGLAVSQLLLRDPQGGNHHHYIYPDDRGELYPREDPTQWQVMDRVVILPPGSIPGIWGLAEVTAQDRAGNLETFNFVEIVRFDVEGS